MRTRRVFTTASCFLAVCLGVSNPAKARTQAPLSLADAVAAAQQHSSETEKSAASEEQARGSVREAHAAFLPTLTLAEEAFYSNDPVFAFGSELRQGRFSQGDFSLEVLNHPRPLSNFSASAAASYTAFDGGSRRHGVAAADDELQATAASAAYTAQALTAEVTMLYYRVLTAEEQVGVAAAVVQRAQETDSLVQDRLRAGLVLESDAGRSALSQRRAQDELASARDNVQLARGDLFARMGEQPSEQPLVKPSINAEDTAVSAVPDLSRRTDLKALQLRQEALKEKLAAVRASARPQVTIFGRVENDAQYVVTNGSGNWFLGAKVQLQVFDGGVRRSRESEVLAQMHGFDGQRRAVLLSAEKTVAALQNRMEDLKRRLSTAREAVRVQSESLDAARDRYAAGLLTLSDVLEAQSELAQSEFDNTRTFYELCIAKAELAFASGTPTR